MKLSTATIFSAIASASAFTVLPNAVTPAASNHRMYFADEETAQNETAEKKSTNTIYDRLGFAEDEIAIGVKPSEVLQWLGNRDDIIAKFQKDNKGMEDERIQDEVKKFMLDREMVESFIAFEKRKADPRNLKAEAEANLSDPSTWGVYAVWIAGGAGFAYFKNVIAAPKYASGEWEEIHITLPGAEKFAQAAADKAAAEVAASIPVEAVSSAVDTVSTVVDAASSAI